MSYAHRPETLIQQLELEGLSQSELDKFLEKYGSFIGHAMSWQMLEVARSGDIDGLNPYQAFSKGVNCFNETVATIRNEIQKN